MKAEILNAVRLEMFQKINDLIRRSTELGATGLSGMVGLRSCAEITSKENDWCKESLESEIAGVIP